jgi:hypothetical protein
MFGISAPNPVGLRPEKALFQSMMRVMGNRTKRSACGPPTTGFAQF